MVGLEIGPLDKPLVRRAPDRPIFYADYAPREVLREKSRGDPNVDIDAIPAIDHIIDPLPDSLGRRFDYIVASHVAEHVPDLLGWLNRLFGWLSPGGQVVLALPDKRFTFDVLREQSTVGELIEAYLQRRQRPPVAAIYDGFSRAVRVNAMQIWQGAALPDPLDFLFTREVSLSLARDALENGTYRDCHCWVFSASHFRALLEEAREMGLISFEWVRFVEPTLGQFEFYVSLRPGN